VDPWAHFVNVYMLDREGRRIDRRNAQHAVVALYDHQIPPGASHTLHYRVRVPEEIRDGLRLRARLNYRKFDTTYLRHIQGEAFRGNHLPVTVIAEADLSLDGADGTPPTPTWMRWNDYGIGLLLTPGAGLLRQAEQAFLRVAESQPEPGLVNLARVYLREGRLQEAGAMLARAAEMPNLRAPWTLTWLGALVDTQNGELQAAADKLQRLLRTDFAGARERGFDFSGDYRVWNQLGQVRLEQAKALRGAGRTERRRERLQQARAAFAETLGQDPENLTAHYGLSQVYTLLGNPQAAAFHSAEHTRYKPDDNAGDRAVALHRARNPAANRGAEAVVIYELRGEAVHGG
jgi:tetratricopeptide (TPR) repeat protein